MKNAYYIRSEGMITDIKDIEQIVVANRNGIPVPVSYTHLTLPTIA